ncbi:CbtA family protein [Halorussus sp. AFM4]|uniref:CbtA family protein n=1 Tax=Halorussus sp. AFM4 TaxID=3421651 RepID=UPI003EBE9953
MFARYVVRGAKAGLVGGLAFAAFVALVANPLVGYAETFEHSHGGGPVVSGAVTAAVSVAGGVLLGVLFGAVAFGAAFYFLEPAVPGSDETKSYVLAAAGFVTVSGAPWLVLPPQPPGVEQALATDVRLAWYLGMMVVGAVACGLSLYAFARLRPRHGRLPALAGGCVPLALIPLAASAAAANPASGAVPARLATVFRAVTASGQLGLWFVIATAHVWFVRRERAGDPDAETTEVADTPGSVLSD